MEYLILAAALLILFVIYLIRCSLEEKKLWRNLKKSLTENYGKPSTKKYQEGRLKTIAGHFQNKKTEDAIDAITWNDLDLDRVFQSMDFTLSAAGEESLYTMLRCPVFEEDIYDAISMETCVNKRNTIGAPGKVAMEKVIAIEEAYLVTE